MARLVEKTIKKPLSEMLLFEHVREGGRVVVDVHQGALRLTHA
jgi:ATP-dependent Clp protease ATP-binding subunit ClpA